jgi:hypothetical protein
MLHLSPGASTAGTAPGAAPVFTPGTTEALVAEALAILSSKDIRMSAQAGGRGAGGRAAGGDADEDAAAADADDGGEAAASGGAGGAVDLGVVASLAAAKSRLLAKLARKQVIENVVPICMGVKQLVAAARSPLLGPLMAYIRSLFNDYGDDVKGGCLAARRACAVRACCVCRPKLSLVP